jgi:peroxiredoxin Q/BCP
MRTAAGKASVIVAMVLATGLLAARGQGVDVKVGDLAPQFSLPGSDGRTYRLADYRGKQAVVLAWFAKAFTSG